VALKVPFIIYDPKSPQTKTKKIDRIVELIDLFPTIVDVAGLPEVQQCRNSLDYVDESTTCTEGKSLRGQMSMLSEALEDEEAFSQFPRPGPSPTKSPDSDQPKLREIKIMGYSIRTRQFRYTAWIKYNNKKYKRSEWELNYFLRLSIHAPSSC
jgi:iduronate 2-sulfatase